MENKPENKPSKANVIYMFKLLLYMFLGSLWLKIHSTALSTGVPVPIGLILGLLFAGHEYFRIGHKIEYGVLVVAALVGLTVPFGLFIST